MPNTDSAGFEVLDEEECYALLATTALGRVAVSVDAMPAIFPVNFVVINRQVVFSTGLGTKLTAALAGAVVGFEADWVDDRGQAAWSVQAVGRCMIVEPGSDTEAAALVAVRALAPVPRRFLVKVRPLRISGRRLPAPSSGR
jgi:nitroimidazol reductase NimA-like FMN-containing flavoprotein (pyridoxamine 5'-phosphate oxidase superfamily)